MKLGIKLSIFTSIIVLISIVVVALFSIYQFKMEMENSIEIYRHEETERVLDQLKDIVNISYLMIDNSYRASTKVAIEERYGITFSNKENEEVKMIALNMLLITIDNLRELRFGVNGYVWINEFEIPYKVVMHPIKPEYEGYSKVLFIGDNNKNIYEAYHDSIVEGSGEGRVICCLNKPDYDEKKIILSWLKLHEPLGWVIGTGVYIDYIDKIITKKKEELEAQIIRLILVISLVGYFLFLTALVSLLFFSETISKPIFEIQEKLFSLTQGKFVGQLNIKQNDEIGQVKKSLNSLIIVLSMYSKFADEIGADNSEYQFTPLNDQDFIGNSLVSGRK